MSAAEKPNMSSKFREKKKMIEYFSYMYSFFVLFCNTFYCLYLFFGSTPNVIYKILNCKLNSCKFSPLSAQHAS